MNLEKRLNSLKTLSGPSPEIKARTLHAMEQARPGHLLLRRPTVVLAAVLVLVIGLSAISYAAGWLPLFTERFAKDLGEEKTQKAIIEELGVPLGVSDTSDGITVTAQAMLNDGRNIALLLSVRRDDGQPLAPANTAGFGHLIFGSTGIGGDDVTFASQKDTQFPFFSDYAPGDAEGYVLYGFTLLHQDVSELDLSFGGLEAWTEDNAFSSSLSNGRWEFTVPLASVYEGPVLTAGEVRIHVSPLSVMAISDASLEDHTLVLRLKDGREIDLSSQTDLNGITSSMGYMGEDESFLGGLLPEIIPLEQMESVLLDGVSYPVQ